MVLALCNWTEILQNSQTGDKEFFIIKKERKKKDTINKNSHRFWQNTIILKECDFIL